MDRLSPATRPAGSNAGTQRWRELLFVHWVVDAAALRRQVPEPLELDLHEGRALVGAVPFLMRDIAPTWWPNAMAFNFYETNLRTYVSYKGEPGVFFFSLEASSYLAVKAARVGWGLPYHYAQMSGSSDGAAGDYRSERRDAGRARFNVRYTVGDAVAPTPVDAQQALPFFLLERYYLFAKRGDKLTRGQVHHPPYPAFEASLLELDETLLSAAGLPSPGEPLCVHYSPGVDVEVFAPVVV